MKPDSLRKTHSLSTRNLFIFLAIFVGVLWLVYPAAKAQLARSQDSLVDIRDIETLRARFNEDAGQTRLVILLNPT